LQAFIRWPLLSEHRFVIKALGIHFKARNVTEVWQCAFSRRNDWGVYTYGTTLFRQPLCRQHTFICHEFHQ